MRTKMLRTGSAVLAALLLFVPPRAGWSAEYVQTAVDKLNVRSGPGLTHTVIDNLPQDTTLEVVSREGEWIHVTLPNGQEGWVAGWLVKPSSPASPSVQTPEAGGETPAPATETPAPTTEVPAPTTESPAAVSGQTGTLHIQSKVTNLNVRSGPSLDDTVLGKIQPGPTYPLIQKQGQWAQIRWNDQQTGWVALWLVEEVPASTGTPQPPADPQPTPPASPAPGSEPVAVSPTLTLTRNTDVYLEPTTSSPVIGQLSAGDAVSVKARSGSWVQIVYDGQTAWVQVGSPSTGNGGSGTAPQPPGNSGPVHPTPAPSGGQARGTVTVTASAVNLRSEPTIHSRLLGTLSHGTVLPVISVYGDWYQVQTSDGRIGWVAGWLVSQSGKAAAGKATVTILEPDTNIRSGPSTRTAVIRRAKAGETFQVVRQEGDWYRILLADGRQAYVAGWLVDAEGVDDVEVVVRGDELKGKVIVLDPGHGGSDAGAIGRSFSTLEKIINLQVANHLKQKLESVGAKVLMTRSDDRGLSLEDRVAIAVNNRADLFVSIHHNTHPNPLTNGSIVFYYEPERSGKLASLVQRELVKATDYRDLLSRFGNYHVLRENSVPAILAEIGFLTNPEEEAKLRSPRQQQLAADGIFKGIVRYYQSGT